MGFESPSNLDSNIEKPKNFGAYCDKLKAELEKQETVKHSLVTSEVAGKGKVSEAEIVGAIKRVNSLKDELSRLDALVETEGKEILEKPISEIITIFENAKRDANNEYEEKFKGQNLNELSIDERDDAQELIDGVDQFDKIIDRMIKFES